VAWGLTVAVGVQGQAPWLTPGVLPRRATWVRWSGSWGRTRACSTAARGGHTWTPLVNAAEGGHVGVVRWLVDQGAATNNASHDDGYTALCLACLLGRTPVVRLLLERGADPTTANNEGWTPLVTAPYQGHLEVVRLLLGHASAKATTNCRSNDGRTALWVACYRGRRAVVRALLENGADPTTASNDGTTPTATAKQDPPGGDERVSAEGRRECVAALEVRSCAPLLLPHHLRFWSAC
jgi:hypothetical protein